MSKKKKRNETINVYSSIEATLAFMPKYNTYHTFGTGSFNKNGDKKVNGSKNRAFVRKEFNSYKNGTY